jgi:hypothetical protein
VLQRRSDIVYAQALSTRVCARFLQSYKAVLAARGLSALPWPASVAISTYHDIAYLGCFGFELLREGARRLIAQCLVKPHTGQGTRTHNHQPLCGVAERNLQEVPGLGWHNHLGEVSVLLSTGPPYQ